MENDTDCEFSWIFSEIRSTIAEPQWWGHWFGVHMTASSLDKRITSKIGEIDAKIATLRRMQASHSRVAVSYGNGGRMAGKIETLIAVLIDERNNLADLIWKS